jgi:F5/8 type C domain
MWETSYRPSVPGLIVTLPSHWKTIALATGVYAALTFAYFWPLSADPGSAIAHDAGDPVLNTWILWWTTKAVPLTADWWNAPIFWPASGTLAFSEHLLGLAPISAPLIALSGNPLLGYNVALMATSLLSALGAHFLAFTLTRRHDVSAVAALAYAFAPYRLAQVPHIQVLAGWWIPVCVAALHRFGNEPRARWAALAAGAWLLQGLTNGYYLFFLPVLLALWFAWFAVGRWSLKQTVPLAGFFTLAAVLLLPFMLGYRRILTETYGFSRGPDEIRMFSADAAGLLLASEELLLWGWVQVIQRPESALFPGVTIVILAALALSAARPFAIHAGDSPRMRMLRPALVVILIALSIAAVLPMIYGTWRLTIGGLRLLSIGSADRPLALAVAAALALLATFPRIRASVRERSTLVFYAAAALIMWVLALGPEPTVMNTRVLSQAPYGWLMQMPGFDGLRVPARFWTLALACLSVVGALAVHRVKGRARRIAVTVACAGLVLDGWPRTFAVVVPPGLRPSPAGVTTRLDLPMSDDIDAQGLYQQMFDRTPLHNGFSGYLAPHYYALRTLINGSDPRILGILAGEGALGVVIDHAGDRDGRLRRYVLSHPGAAVERTHDDWSSYRIPGSSLVPALPDREGTPLGIRSLSTFPSPPHAARALDGNLRTRWSGGVQQQSADAIVELDRPSFVRQIVIELGGFVTDFPARLQIDVSRDGATWDPAWTGDTALHAYFGAIRHPREMPLVFELKKEAVRFIRLRQTGFGAHDWSVAELHVLQ